MGRPDSFRPGERTYKAVGASALPCARGLSPIDAEGDPLPEGRELGCESIQRAQPGESCRMVGQGGKDRLMLSGRPSRGCHAL